MASEENGSGTVPQTDSTQNDSNKQEATEPLMAAGPGGEQQPVTKPAVHKQNYEKDVIYLYQFSRTPVLPSMSPYCLKVETWLRLAGLKYEVSPMALNVIEPFQDGATGGQSEDPQCPRPNVCFNGDCNGRLRGFIWIVLANILSLLIDLLAVPPTLLHTVLKV